MLVVIFEINSSYIFTEEDELSKKEYINGLHSVKIALKYDSASIDVLMVDKRRTDNKVAAIMAEASKKNVDVRRVDKKELDNLCPEENHQGVMLVVNGVKPQGETEFFELIKNLGAPPFILVLDSVQDPHNLGACMRTANAAGVHAVIAPRDKAVGLTSVVHKVSCGASQATPFFQVTNLSRILKQMQKEGIWIVGAAGEVEQSYFDVDYKGAIAIVLGSEGEGLRRLTRENCDYLVKIPMTGIVESLNVSVAAGIFMFEARKQRDLG